MKILIPRFSIFSATLAVTVLAAGYAPQPSRAQTPPDAPAATDANADAGAPPEDALPSNIPPGSPLAQVVQLAQSGVDEGVIMAYITNSGSAFGLTSDQIIYLKDLGLPNDAVTAMIQRDQQLGVAAVAPPAATPEAAVQPEVPVQPAVVTQNYFYDSLSPYGGWVNVEGYGLCWRPTAVVYDSGWQPYCDHGHWVYTDSGWYWTSDYSWGATTFHYGRWFRDTRLGWCWWPDRTWAPSWVTWRYADDYCGWAPLPPFTACVSGGGFIYRGTAVSVGFSFGLGVNFFTFVHTRDFCDPHPRRHRAAPAEVTRIYNRTTVINNFNINSRDRTVINHGIPPQRISAATGTEIRTVRIRESSTPAPHGDRLEGGTLVVNRPHLGENAATLLNHGDRPRAVSTSRQNTSRPPAMRGNGNNNPGNNGAPRVENPRQNISSPPGRTGSPLQQTPRVNQTPTPRTNPRASRTPGDNSPVLQQQPPSSPASHDLPPARTPRSTYDPDKRVFSPRQQEQQLTPRVPARNFQERGTPGAPQQQSPAPAERQQDNGSRQNFSPPAPRNTAPEAPAASSGSQRSDHPDRDQNGRQR